MTIFFFFFSSRRRHTRSKRDWSSDVCSSDLNGSKQKISAARADDMCRCADICSTKQIVLANRTVYPSAPRKREIGRASCRERVEISGVAVSLKRKKIQVTLLVCIMSPVIQIF